jgi:hypothetical protein
MRVCVRERERTVGRERNRVIKSVEERWCVRYSSIHDLQKCCWSQHNISIHQYGILFPRDGNKGSKSVIYIAARENLDSITFRGGDPI